MSPRIAAELISQLEPGQTCCIPWRELDIDRSNSALASFLRSWTETTILDEIMGQVVGSAFTIKVTNDPIKRCFWFDRLKVPLDDNNGLMTWVYPDRRMYYTQLPNGLWKRNDVQFHPRRAT